MSDLEPLREAGLSEEAQHTALYGNTPIVLAPRKYKHSAWFEYQMRRARLSQQGIKLSKHYRRVCGGIPSRFDIQLAEANYRTLSPLYASQTTH